MKKLVSVIVPVYNVEKYIDKCVESLLNQDYKNIEVILVDDGIPDRSGDIIDRLKEEDHRIVVIHQENLEYKETYKECVSNLRKNIFLPLKMEKSIKKKIMWCCYFISTRLMAIRTAIGFKKAAKTVGGIRNNFIIKKTAYILVPITGGAFA